MALPSTQVPNLRIGISVTKSAWIPPPHRPAVWVTRDALVLRGMFHTDRVPLAAIDKVVVTQVLAVSAGGRRFVSPAIGYSIRQTVKSRRARSSSKVAGLTSGRAPGRG